MKHKMSISLDKEVAMQILDLLREDMFRNKSHVVEYALKQLIKQREK